MALDFIKLQTRDVVIIEKIITNGDFTQITHMERTYMETGEIYTKDTLIDIKRGIILNKKPYKKTEILFKPHYQFNKGLHNADDFSVKNCIEIIKIFILDLGLNEAEIKSLKFVNIEYGINFVPISFNAKHFIDRYLGFHEKKAFRNSDDNQYSKISAPSENPNYKLIKFYAKGIQFPKYCDSDTLRFETRSRKSEFIQKLGIYNLFDLLNVTIYHHLFTSLLNEFDKILILEPINDFSSYTDKEIARLKEYSNPNVWKQYIDSSDSEKKNRNKFNNEKIKYIKLLERRETTIRKEIRDLLLQKEEQLMYGCNSSLQEIIKENKRCAIRPYTIRGQIAHFGN